MLIACITLRADGTDAIVTVRAMKRGTPVTVYSGLFSQWDSLNSDIKKHGRCIICIYEGEAVHSIDRTENKELSADLVSNAKMMAEVCPDDRTTLLFVDKKDISGLRRKLADSGVEIIAEHLVQNSRLESDKALIDYYDRVCKRELSLNTGTIDERRMFIYRISRLRAKALPILAMVFVLSLGASLIDMHTVAEKERLLSLMRSYSITMDKSKHSVVDIEKVLSTREEAVPCSISSIMNFINSISAEGILLKSISVCGKTLVVNAMAARSRFISNYSRAFFESRDVLFDNVEVSEVKQSAVEGKIDFMITAHIK